MARLLLVQHTSHRRGACPLGLATVAATARDAGHAVDFIDVALERHAEPARVVRQRAREFLATTVGFSVMTANAAEARRLACSLRRELNGVRFLVGGAHAHVAPRDLLADDTADIVVTGEAEGTLPRLLACLDRREHPYDVEGVAFVHNGRAVQTTPAPQVKTLDALPSPPWDLLRPERYSRRIRGRRSAYLVTSRGCPYNCTHCHRGPTGGSHLRRHSVDRVLNDIHRLKHDHGIGAISFRDDVFTLDRRWTLRLCRSLMEANRPVVWDCQTRVDRVDRQLLAAMKKAGCVGVMFGIESGDEKILSRLNKRFTTAQARRAVATCRAVGLPTIAFFMLGTPWETPQSAARTIRFAATLRATMCSFFVATPYPGTELRRAFLEAGLHEECEVPELEHVVFGPGAHRHGHASTPRHDAYATLARKAVRTVARAKLLDVPGYPATVRGYLTRFTVRELIRNTAVTTTDLLRRYPGARRTR